MKKIENNSNPINVLRVGATGVACDDGTDSFKDHIQSRIKLSYDIDRCTPIADAFEKIRAKSKARNV